MFLGQGAKTAYENQFSRSGNANGKNWYGQSLEAGIGNAKNASAAAEYFKLWADQGNAEVQRMYATCLCYGKGVARNKSAVVEYFKMSVCQGNARVQSDDEDCLADDRSGLKSAPGGTTAAVMQGVFAEPGRWPQQKPRRGL